ncbi:HIT family protein [Paenibacillus sp. N1-5-1-14]|uniref:HIT family protein n=1 Tax=Paenibacillus radicibacter TaxID=2972488 RepID=UPI002158CDAA|nr:HIT family protein [Paenibacillus radicibacter]MCR8644416.1 HIT family protein [Paenibacillus radicibacter]
MEKDCLGCKLANGKMSAHVVYENDRITCILDHEPLNEGHILIMPKKHYADLSELDDKTSIEIMKASTKLAKLLTHVYEPDGITVIQNSGLFNDLDHYHMHVFPRYIGDGFSWVEPEDKKRNRERLKETLEKLLQQVS